ncbi:hypothetical protein [Fischerella thermalis]|uniref:Uncharacterized protein n=1 Tax=Fischerella thermalis CCMEE 5318 TaxID=2019666 RepID=A0A2N6L3N9_9CYAN|nr:hypothetical protein [Fischerella thermalis]PMB14893.1 hypothetical protein CEN46_26355 [Fischerella thermalis CCMEE 5318]
MMKYSQIVEVNQLLNSEEIVQQYTKPQTQEKVNKRAFDLAFSRWHIMPKAISDGLGHPQMAHLKMVIR